MQDKILEAMQAAGKPVRPGDIAKQLGLESKDVSKATQELKKEGKVHSPKRCFCAASLQAANPPFTVVPVPPWGTGIFYAFRRGNEKARHRNGGGPRLAGPV